MAGGGQAKPDYAEVIPVNEGGRTTQLEAGAAFLPIKQRGGNGVPATGRRRRKVEEKRGATANEPLLEQPELNLREKFAEVRRRLGYVQKRGHNERHNYNYVMAADLAGSVGDILAELGVVVIPQPQSISTETPRSSSDRIGVSKPNLVAAAVRLAGGPGAAATICGVSRQTIYDWINERRVERLIDALRLSRASGVAIENLAGDDVEKLAAPVQIPRLKRRGRKTSPDSPGL